MCCSLSVWTDLYEILFIAVKTWIDLKKLLPLKWLDPFRSRWRKEFDCVFRFNSLSVRKPMKAEKQVRLLRLITLDVTQGSRHFPDEK